MNNSYCNIYFPNHSSHFISVDAKLSLYTFDISIQRITTALFSSSKHLSAWQLKPYINLLSVLLALRLTYAMHHPHGCNHRSQQKLNYENFELAISIVRRVNAALFA